MNWTKQERLTYDGGTVDKVVDERKAMKLLEQTVSDYRFSSIYGIGHVVAQVQSCHNGTGPRLPL